MPPEYGDLEYLSWCRGTDLSHSQGGGNVVLALRAACRDLLAATEYAFYTSDPKEVLDNFERDFRAVQEGHQHGVTEREEDVKRREEYFFMKAYVEKIQNDWKVFQTRLAEDILSEERPIQEMLGKVEAILEPVLRSLDKKRYQHFLRNGLHDVAVAVAVALTELQKNDQQKADKVLDILFEVMPEINTPRFRDLFHHHHLDYEPFNERYRAEIGKKWNYYHSTKPKT